MNFLSTVFFLVLFSSPVLTFAQLDHSSGDHKMTSHFMPTGPKDCEEMMIWDMTSAACVAVPMKDMPMGMWMVHGNGFLTQTFSEGPRARNEISLPNMIMTEAGHSWGDHYLNVNLMLTFEKWTFPKKGYPELLQIGEKNADHEPYIDAQHPHSSPIMGLTFSDMVRLEGDNFLKIFFAPRGQATDGPVAFMHRPTGMVNPDAPLGHHIGQDVSHITSTVLGAGLYAGRALFEVSAFNGTEPEPTKVDLPIGPLNSFSTRLAYRFSDSFFGMVSASEVTDPEPDEPDLKKIWRYGGSFYWEHDFINEWKIYDTFIYGLVNNYDHISALRSFLYEFWLHSESPNQYWGRLEVVERAGGELGISNIVNASDPKWVTALTLGYTYKWRFMPKMDLGIGAGVTKNFLPTDFQDSYGGDPWAGKVFLQISGMSMGQY